MKKSIFIGISFVIVSLIIIGVITNYIDSGRVTTGHEPKYCLKVINHNGSKVTYYGLGYKVIRYVGVSPNEPFKNSIGVKMGSWFMKYELPEEKIITVEYKNKIINITSQKNVNRVANILINSKYEEAPCDGIITHKLTYDNHIYYIKEGCQAIQKDDKQAMLSTQDLESIQEIIKNN